LQLDALWVTQYFHQHDGLINDSAASGTYESNADAAGLAGTSKHKIAKLKLTFFGRFTILA